MVPAAADRDLPPRTILRDDPVATDHLPPEVAESYREYAVRPTAQDASLFAEVVHPAAEAADPAVLERISARYAPSGEVAPGFDGPTLWLLGRQDHVVGYRDQLAVLERYPRATVAVLDAAGHNGHLQRPDVARALVTDWLARVRDELS